MVAENGPLDGLRAIRLLVDKWRASDPKLAELGERFNVVLIELDDISAEAANQLESLEMDPERQAFLVQAVDKFNALLRKHHLTNQQELQELARSLEQKLENTQTIGSEIEELEVSVAKLHAQSVKKAQQLHTRRLAGAKELKKHLTAILTELKLPDTRLEFVLEEVAALETNGLSKVSLLFSANAGSEPKPIEKTASGGELSRLMLAVQATLSEKKALPTLILDEIDTGVSGEVALRIGKLLHEMGKRMQLFAITHLPQVAAKGQQQYEVSKRTTGSVTNTAILPLSSEERLDAIAKLMSGDTISEASRANAQVLLG
jgi:DNA repair protein RecN (Recombination protein N)